MAKTYIRTAKVCQFCHEEFIAQTTVTKHCSDNCAKRAYKKRKREEKVLDRTVPAKEHVASLLKREQTLPLTKREFLSPVQAADLLGSTRMTIYRLTKSGQLRSLRLGAKVLISRRDINTLLGL